MKSTTAILLACILFPAACGGPAPAQKTLDDYRIGIGAQEFTFDQQMLYLVLALEIYRLHVGAYPSEKNNLEALISQPEILEATGRWMGPYVETSRVFQDPWGRRLQYRVDDQGKMHLKSLGGDGSPSEDDLSAEAMFPDIYREIDKLPSLGPIPVNPKP
ncbi:MAG: hypothetical protein HPY51_14105 [Candidatus Omnitrophica bacterium]|nr:hypothetical protein [Candidatus Omnitrophota bacterium]